ncbi:MAG: OB-fold nucleic acid binding domain-containing protein [Nanoarchaeota archaeon]
MYKIPLPELKEKIIASGKIALPELEKKIKEKINELSGLISEEGAAHIIANELGIQLFPKGEGKLKIKEIYAGMREVGTVGKVVRKFEVREFTKEERTGKVCSIILGDETGTIRVVFWNEQVELLANVKEGDILQIKDAYVRENNNDREIHLGSRGEVKINPLGESIGLVKQSTSYERKKIGQLQEDNAAAEILGTVVQIFDLRFFNVCPECNKRVIESEGGFMCSDHGAVLPRISYVLNIMLDDGSGVIRGVFWREQTESLLDMKEEEILFYKDNLSSFEDIKTDLLGEQFKLTGRVKKNLMFDRLEFSVQTVNKARPEEEIARLEKL